MTVTVSALLFLGCALLIAYAGFLLARSADRLAMAYGWSRGWVGLALLATVTSLPELTSGISAVALVQAPDLAVGNALGACVINLLFLVVVDMLQPDPPVYRQASASHLLSAGFGVVMLGFVALSLVAGARAPSALHVGLYSPALLGLYLLAVRSVHLHARECVEVRVEAVASRPPTAAIGREWRCFVFAAVLVLFAGSLLPEFGRALSQATGLAHSFVGTVFMALATTLPEMAVTVVCLRMRALDLAIGNLLGSNLFNVLILAIDDAAYTRGPLLAAADKAHVGTVLAALVMTGLVIVGLVIRPQGRVLRVIGWISVGLIATYLIYAVSLDPGIRQG